MAAPSLWSRWVGGRVGAAGWVGGCAMLPGVCRCRCRAVSYPQWKQGAWAEAAARKAQYPPAHPPMHACLPHLCPACRARSPRLLMSWRLRLRPRPPWQTRARMPSDPGISSPSHLGLLSMGASVSATHGCQLPTSGCSHGVLCSTQRRPAGHALCLPAAAFVMHLFRHPDKRIAASRGPRW